MNERTDVVNVEDVTKRYDGVKALDGLSLSIEEGSNYGLLGTNGAGKTTLFKLLVGHARPDTGTIEVLGRNVESAGKDVRRSVGYLPQNAGFPGLLTAREVVTYHARMHGIPKDNRGQRVERVLESVGLTSDADRRVKGFSGGMQLRLGLASAILPEPEVLFLDEPTAGLDPLGVTEFHEIIEELQEDRVSTVVISSHVLTEAERLCDNVAILHEGRLMAEGPTEELGRRTGSEDEGLEALFRKVVAEDSTATRMEGES